MAVFFAIAAVPLPLALIFYCLTWHPLTSLGGYPNLPDYCTRILQDDSVISSYYFFWTSFTYLPNYFFSLCLTVAIAVSYFSVNLKLLLSLVALLLYSTESLDFGALSLHQFLVDPSVSELNVLLLNPLNRFHPFFFYLSVALTLVTLIRIAYLSFTSAPSVEVSLSIARTYFGVVVNLGALFMGSWWALQEGTWGGWWNWDPSEVFGLLPTCVALWYLHASGVEAPNAEVLFKALASVPVVVSFYFFIQLNFDLVSHNFGSNFFFFFNHNLFFLEGLLLCGIIGSFFIGTKGFLFPMVEAARGSLRTSPVWRLLPFASVCYWVGASYLPLVNYFAWNFAGLNILNFTPTYGWTVWAITFTLLVYFSPTILSSARLLPLYAPLLTPPVFHSLSGGLPLPVMVLHMAAMSALFFNLRYGLFYTVAPESTVSGLWFEYGSILWMESSSSFVLAYSGWEEVTSSPLALNSSTLSWLAYGESNSSVLNQFLLPTGSFWSTNTYVLANSYVCFFLKLTVWSPLPLATLFVATIISLVQVSISRTLKG